eukprot:UN10782
MIFVYDMYAHVILLSSYAQYIIPVLCCRKSRHAESYYTELVRSFFLCFCFGKKMWSADLLRKEGY